MLFSIIIPTYNRAGLVGATIESVLAQSFREFEIVVVDDGSTDRTPEVLQAFGKKIVAIRQDNRGAEAARHHGAALAQGQYLALLDSDDLLLPDALAIYARAIHSIGAPQLLIAKMCRFHTGDPLPTSQDNPGFIEALKYHDYFNRDRSLAESCSQLVVKRSVAEDIRAFRPKLTAFPLDSCDILLALGACSPCVAIQYPATVAYRHHDSNSSGNLEHMVHMAPRLLNLTRQNAYSGYNPHRFARFANLGGIMFSYLRQCVHTRRLDLACKVVQDSWPMLFAAIARKLALQFRRKVSPLKIEFTMPSSLDRSVPDDALPEQR